MIRCKDCGSFIIGEESGNRKPCENCKSIRRVFSVTVEDKIILHDSLGYKIKNKYLKGKKKVKIETIDRLEESMLEDVELVRHIRIIDRENDKYIERVIDWEKKVILHEMEEKLSEHRHHGRAKFKTYDT